MRGTRADDGDEAVERVLVAVLEEIKQAACVGAVIGESGRGRLIATNVENAEMLGSTGRCADMSGTVSLSRLSPPYALANAVIMLGF